MAVTLVGGTGLFDTLGQLFYQMDTVANNRLTIGGGAYLTPEQILGTVDQTTEAGAVFDGLQAAIESQRHSADAWKSYLVTAAQNYLIEAVHLDAILTDKTLYAAMKELIRQMAGTGGLYNPDNDVDAPTVTATVTALSTNTGSGKVVATVTRPDARTCEYAIVETMEVTVTSDSGLGATARSEPCDIKGEVPYRSGNRLDPLGFSNRATAEGSGFTGSTTTSDAALDASAGNLLYNGDFDSFTTTNQPDYWGAPLVGVVGTDIFEDASVVYRTGKALKFLGTGGGPNSSIAQTFGVTSPAVGTSGTSTVIKPSTVYHFNCFVKDSGAGLLAGVMEISLVNGSNAIITDDAGADIKATIAFNGTTASYAAFNSGSSGTGITSRAFVTPKVLPSTVKLRVRISTALTSGEAMYIDDLTFVEATPTYPGGPYISVHAGATAFAKDDKFTIAVANNKAGDFQHFFDVVFGMRTLGPAPGLQLPSDTGAAETVADTLIADIS